MLKNRFLIVPSVLFILLGISGSSYSAPGDLDPTFDEDGMVTTLLDCPLTRFGSSDDLPLTHSMALSPEGKIVFASSCDGLRGMAIARYNSDGGLDTTFGDDGKLLLDPDAIRIAYGRALYPYPFVKSMVIQSDGRMIIAGSTTDVARGFLIRLNADGSPDRTFGTNGLVIFSFIFDGSTVEELSLQTDGKILAGGYLIRSGSEPDVMVWRFNRDGSLDSSFTGSPTPGRLVDMAVGLDGKIVVINTVHAEDLDQRRFTIARYLPTGALDTSFGGDGVEGDDDEDYRFGSGIAIDLLPDGRVIAAAISSRGAASVLEQSLYRFHVDGSPDASFGGSGRVPFQPDGIGYEFPLLNNIAVSGEKIVAVGSASDKDFLVTRFNRDGSVDSVFTEVTAFAGTEPEVATNVLIQGDGKVLVGGYGGAPSVRHVAMARYQAETPLTYPLPIPGYSPGSRCLRLTCASRGANCGTIGDGCGGMLNCGTCTLPQVCGARTPNVCGTRLTIPWWKSGGSGFFQKSPAPLPSK